jgi:hypothetical protein
VQREEQTMRNPAILATLGLAVSLLGLWPSSQAHACSPIKCAPSIFLPVSGTVPSNAIEFLWHLPRDLNSTPPSATVRLFKLINGERSEIPSEVVDGPDGFKRVRPAQVVPEGTELVLDSEEPACLTLRPEPARITVAAASPKPTSLGTLQASVLEATTLNIPTSRGSCTADFRVAKVDLKLALDVAARPFVDSMRHALVVDGELRSQRRDGPLFSDLFGLGGKLEDVVYTLCGERSDGWTRDLLPGSHRIQWLVTLPDGSELRSDETTVDLQCPATSAVGSADASAAGSSAPPTASSEEEQRPDPASENEESSASADDAEPEARRVKSGCALGTAADSAPSSAWILVLAMWLIRRHRRREAGSR